MALDMYAGDLRDEIDFDEEFLLISACKHEEQFPHLTNLWEAFYDGPRLAPNIALALAEELAALLETESFEPNLNAQKTVERLGAFFRGAYSNQQQINCMSD